MLTINIDFDIPSLGITLHPDNHLEFNSTTTKLSVTITLPVTSSPPLSRWNNTPPMPKLLEESKSGSLLKPLRFVDEPLKHKTKTEYVLPSLKEQDALPAPTTIAEPELVTLAKKCIANGGVALCPDGVGGTYFIKNEKGKIIGLFKPTDEEPGAVDNPKKVLETPLLPPGGGAKREVAAYLIDKARAGVPETYFISGVTSKAFHSSNGEIIAKSGSIQKFVENIGDTTSMGSTSFSVQDVHNIGILDIRIMNMDRNDENMLVRKESDQHRLVPIDHAYTFPDTLDNVWFDWMYWRQTKEPFSQETLEYIKSINIDEDAEILKSLGLEESCIRNMKISTTLLKKGAAAGLSLFNIASIISRKRPSQKSELELLVDQANEGGNFVIAEFHKLVDEFIQSKLKELK